MSVVVDGTYRLGPDTARLTVHTRKTGAASKAGHNLLIEVGEWSAVLTLAAEPGETTLELSANPASLRVLEGSGGVQSLGEDDKAGIGQTIREEVLKGSPIEFRSSSVARRDGGLHVDGELELFGKRRPASFELTLDAAGKLSGEAVVRHSDFGVKPYSALFGTLKVADEVRIAVEGQLPEPSAGA